MDSHIIEAALIAAPIGAWFGFYGLALLATRPETPPAAPATEDLGPEPPAVVSLLVNHWEITEDAAESTFLDLGARHILEFRQPANDPMQTTVHIREPAPFGLSPYEQKVFNRVAGLAVDGVVPLTALTFRDKAQAAAWSKQITALIVAEARTHGLSRRRFGPALLGGLTAAAAAVGLSVASGVAYALHHSGSHDVRASLGAGLVAFFVLSSVGARSLGERDTELGRAAASRWLGVRAWLRGHDAFADLPPAAVAVWDRYLSYGAAVGATRVSSAVIDLGMGNRKRVWSSFGGGWHRIRVSYPRFWPRYGKTAPKLILKSVLLGALGVVIVRFWYRGVADALSVDAAHNSGAAAWADLIKYAGLLVGMVLVVYGVYMVVRTVIDLATPVAVTGEVVWTESWRTSTGNSQSAPYATLYYLAIDDGTGDSTRAWALPTERYRSFRDGDTVAITARRWSRRVIEMTVTQQRAGTQIALADVRMASTNTEEIIAAAMGLPTRRTATVGNPMAAMFATVSSTGSLLSPGEVGAALGFPVTVRPAMQGSVVPVDMTEFRAPDGSLALTVVRSGGMIGRMTMRARRNNEMIPGIGDEARGGPGWVAARRGHEVIVVQLGGNVARSTPPGNLAGLLHTAVGRIPAGT